MNEPRASMQSLDDLPVPPAGWPQLPVGISLCMIVKDEERFLADALASARDVVDEINIVDTGSTDATMEIARGFGANVRQVAWRNDFSWARNQSLAMATKRWILVLDADEMLAPKSIDIVRALRKRPAFLSGLWIRCYNLIDDYKGSVAQSNALVRLFPNHERIRFRQTLHEFVALDGLYSGLPSILSTVEIVHRGYLTEVMRERKKDVRNVAIARAAFEAAPQDPFSCYNLAMALLMIEDTDGTIWHFERMRTLGRGTDFGFIPIGLAALGSMYLEKRDEAERAIGVLEEALEIAPTFANAHFTLGKSLMRLGRMGEARDQFVKAIADGEHAHLQMMIDNEIPLWKAHNEIGSTFLHQREFDMALAWYDFALAQRPNAQPVLANRALALEGLGRIDEALAALHALWLDGREDLPAITYLNALLRAGRDREALDLVEAAADAASPATALMLLGTGATLSRRLGATPGPHHYLQVALRSKGVDDAANRLISLLDHYGDLDGVELVRALASEHREVRPVTSQSNLGEVH